MAQRGSGDRHRSTIGPDQAALVSNAKNNNNTNSLFYNGQSVRVPGMGLGKSYMGLVLGLYNSTATGQKTRNGPGRLF